MQNNEKDKERLEQEENKRASEKMNNNDEQQNLAYRARQNEITQSESAENRDSLANQKTSDPLSLKDKNKHRLDDEQDADFGNEQLQ